MATLGSLVLELRADLGRLQTDMNRAVGIVDRSAVAMKKAAGMARSALGGLGAGLIGGLGVAGLASMIRSVVNYGDHLNDLSKSTGASVEQLSFLDFAAKKSGTTLDGLTSSIGRMQKNLIEVAQGGGKQASAALSTLGLSASTLLRTDLVGQLSAVADGLDKIKNPSQRAATAQTLFGKSARELLPLMDEGSAGISEMAARFVELGGVVTKEQAEKFDAFNDSLVDLSTSSSSLARVITGSLAPALTGFFEGVIKAPTAIGDALARLSSHFSVWLSESQIFLEKMEIGTAEGMKNIMPGSFGDASFDKRIADATERLGKAKAALAAEQDLLAMGGGGGGGGIPGSGTSLAGIGDSLGAGQIASAEKLKSAQTDYLNGLARQIALQENSTELAKVQADIASGSAAKFDDATKSTALALANQIDLLDAAKKSREDSVKLEELMADAVEERADLEHKAHEAIISRREAIVDALQTPLEKYIKTVKELLALDLGQETLQRGIKSARTEMEDAGNAGLKLVDVTRELGLTFTSAFEDAIIDGKRFSEVLKSIAQDIARMLIRKSVTEPLFKALTGGDDDGGGLISKAGTWFGGQFGGARAGGGSVERGRYYMVGENGPELFAPGQSGTIIPGGKGGKTVINIFEAPAGTSAQASPDGRTIDIVVGNSMARNIGSNRGAPLGLRPALASR